MKKQITVYLPKGMEDNIKALMEKKPCDYVNVNQVALKGIDQLLKKEMNEE